MTTERITTCCYCGTRAALVLGGKTAHQLQCGSCGAPIARMKMLPVRAPTPQPAAHQRDVHAALQHGTGEPSHRRWASKKKRKSKGLSRRIVSELWDVIDDLID